MRLIYSLHSIIISECVHSGVRGWQLMQGLDNNVTWTIIAYTLARQQNNAIFTRGWDRAHVHCTVTRTNRMRQ